MYFTSNLKMKKPTLCCFTWIAFFELNLTVDSQGKLGSADLSVRWGES